jgi:hypothetical protein
MRVPFYYILIFIILISITSFYLYSKSPRVPTGANLAYQNDNGKKETLCNYYLPRISGYHFIKPLMYAEQGCESIKYAPLNRDIMSLINKY